MCPALLTLVRGHLTYLVAKEPRRRRPPRKKESLALPLSSRAAMIRTSIGFSMRKEGLVAIIEISQKLLRKDQNR